ncbi:MAG: NAD-dependent epimerase/dehydratase family protein [Ketobacter sp.]|nr:MAG: oxidoreductase [Ketobacter sp.]
MKVLLLGATGLVGQSCLTHLLSSSVVNEVIAPTRRSLPVRDRKLYNVLVDFERLDEYPELFDADVILCCLGTTIKQAGSRAQFKKVDYEYCIEAAELGRARCAKAFLLVSAVGASAQSMVFYSRVKGKLETYLRALEYPVLSIYRPSLLLGDRQQNRLGEELGAKVMSLLNPLMVGSMTRYRSISADTVARAMVNECVQLDPSPKLPKVNLYTHQQIVKLADV